MRREFTCGIHELFYRASRPGCPACAAERDKQRMRESLQEVTSKLDIAMQELARLRVQTDIVAAIREAANLLDESDLAFLKATLYEWRDTKGVSLKVTRGGKRNGTPNGFIVIPRKGEPYGHSCSSMGGMAIAAYFDEATNSTGPAKAMEWLVKGMYAHLPGAVAK